MISSIFRWCGLFFKWPFSACLNVFIALGIHHVILNHTNFCTYMPTIFKTIVSGAATEDFVLNPVERKLMLLLSIIGIFGNVIPKYLTNDNAKRHVANRNSNLALIIHIVAGIVTIIGNGFVGVNGGFRSRGKLFWMLLLCDLIHQLSIIILLKNHDGVYALRVGNFTAIILKFTASLNFYNHGAYISDVFFMASFGFMGTRLGSLLFYIIYSIFGYKNGLKYEYFYSVGVALAHLHILMRVPQMEVMAVMSIPIVGWLFYHELWMKQSKPYFFILNCIFSGSLLYIYATTKSSEILYVALLFYYGLTFAMPRFHRNPGVALKDKTVSSSLNYILIQRRSAVYE